MSWEDEDFDFGGPVGSEEEEDEALAPPKPVEVAKPAVAAQPKKAKGKKVSWQAMCCCCLIVCLLCRCEQVSRLYLCLDLFICVGPFVFCSARVHKNSRSRSALFPIYKHTRPRLFSLHFQLREIKAEQKRLKQEQIDAEMKAQRQREREIRLKVRVLFVFL